MDRTTESTLVLLSFLPASEIKLCFSDIMLLYYIL